LVGALARDEPGRCHRGARLRAARRQDAHGTAAPRRIAHVDARRHPAPGLHHSGSAPVLMMERALRVEPFGEVVEVRPGESALAALLRHGRFVRYGCKHGGCGTCRARLVSGACQLSDRTSFSLSDADREAGIALLCSTYVTGGEVVVDLSGVM